MRWLLLIPFLFLGCGPKKPAPAIQAEKSTIELAYDKLSPKNQTKLVVKAQSMVERQEFWIKIRWIALGSGAVVILGSAVLIYARVVTPIGLLLCLWGFITAPWVFIKKIFKIGAK